MLMPIIHKTIIQLSNLDIRATDDIHFLQNTLLLSLRKRYNNLLFCTVINIIITFGTIGIENSKHILDEKFKFIELHCEIYCTDLRRSIVTKIKRLLCYILCSKILIVRLNSLLVISSKYYLN